MNAIGLENFRRFKKLELIELLPLTFLVGNNNSGKSTIVKSLLLLNQYFRSNNISRFDFTSDNNEDVNIVTFGRAKNYDVSDNYIRFSLEIGIAKFSLTIIGSEEDSVCEVQRLEIDLQNGASKYVFEPGKKVSEFLMTQEENEEYNDSLNISAIDKLVTERDQTEKKLSEIPDKLSAEYGRSLGTLNKLNEEIDFYRFRSEPFKKNVKDVILSTKYQNSALDKILDELVQDFNSRYEFEKNVSQESDHMSSQFQTLRAFKGNSYDIKKMNEVIINIINQTRLVYLGASLNKQSTLFLIKDKENPFSKILLEFTQLKIQPGDKVHQFVLKWMGHSGFDIGTNFKIDLVAGEAYQLNILSHNKWIPLADKGMGSIQAMLLIMRIATVMYKKWKEKVHYTVIIEESEINLHPKYQSMLADMFLDALIEGGLHFIVETHSEYLIRRSQVLVAENEVILSSNKNPFRIYYFPKEENKQPYAMNFNSDGTFDKSFGEGFFDEASTNTLKLIRIKRERDNR